MTFRSGYFGVLDEPTLRTIADVTDGRYYRAEEAGQFHEIYRGLARTVGWTRRPTEIAHALAVVAALLLASSVALRIRASPIGRRNAPRIPPPDPC